MKRRNDFTFNLAVLWRYECAVCASFVYAWPGQWIAMTMPLYVCVRRVGSRISRNKNEHKACKRTTTNVAAFLIYIWTLLSPSSCIVSWLIDIIWWNDTNIFFNFNSLYLARIVTYMHSKLVHGTTPHTAELVEFAENCLFFMQSCRDSWKQITIQPFHDQPSWVNRIAKSYQFAARLDSLHGF